MIKRLFALTVLLLIASHVHADGIDAYTVLMLHMDGTDASTTFTDSSSSAKTATANGDAQIDTAQSVFGGASGKFNSGGLTIPDSDDWTIDDDYTVDFRLRFNSVGTTQLVGTINVDPGGNYGWVLFYQSNVLYFYISTNGTALPSISGSFSPSTGTWYHIAATRSGTTAYLFVDGVQIATGTLSDGYNSTATFDVGKRSSGTAFQLNGWIDELRISKGIARWTSNFTPPTEAYSEVSSRNRIILISQGARLVEEPVYA